MDNKNKIADWKLERYLLGELPQEEMQTIQKLESSDINLRERIAALNENSAQILANYPPNIMAQRIKNLAAESESATTRDKASFANEKPALWGRLLPRIALPAVACAALVIGLPIILNSPSHMLAMNGEDHYEDRVKGTTRDTNSAFAAIEVWRKEGGIARKLTNEEVAREGDVIQLRYVVTEKCYGTLVSIDGRGVLTEHLSDGNGGAVELLPGSPVALKNSYELDDAPHYEIFYLITAPQKFNVNDVSMASLITALTDITNSQAATVLPNGDNHSVVAFKLLK